MQIGQKTLAHPDILLYYQAMYHKRTISKVIQNASDVFPAVLIMGPRQVGKTTMFKNDLNGRTSVSLDVMKLRNLARTDPALFFKTYAPPLLIDEVQYVPELLSYIKIIIDRERRNGLFWLTSSYMSEQMQRATEILGGRVAMLNIQGLSRAEKQYQADSAPFLPSFGRRDNAPVMLSRTDIYTNIWQGNYPTIITFKDINRDTFYNAYINSYIERDIRQIISLTQERAFLKFLKIAASKTGQLLNYNEITWALNISVNTVKTWLSALETLGLIYFLYPYTNDIIRTPKLYFFDTGLACWLAGWNTPDVLQNGAMNEAILETYVISEIIKSYWHNGENVNIKYYRDKEKREIDLLIEDNGTIYPVEIKRTATPSLKDVKHFEVLKSMNLKIGKGALICLIETPIKLSEDIVAMPLSYV